MKAKRCSVDGCDRKYKCKGYCSVHYNRVYRGGSTESWADKTWQERFWEKVTKTGSCWVWTASKSPQGYGTLRLNAKYDTAHRVSWEMAHGPIPEGMFIDHRCHNRACVNPDHLRVVTNKQNLENMRGPSSRSKSGIRGVYPLPKRKDGSHAWIAEVRHNDTKYIVGRFESLEEAEAAVIAKRNELYTHNDIDRAQMAGERHIKEQGQ